MLKKLLPAALGLILTVSPLIRAEDARPMTKADVEQAIRSYLLEHPEILIEMSQNLREKQAAEQRAKAKAGLTAHRADLAANSGSPTARAASKEGAVTIVEFFDYRCGYCKRVTPTVQKLIDEDPTIQVVFKEFPILGPESSAAAMAALAANQQGGYLKFHRALMAATDLSPTNIEKIAKESGLDVEKLGKDMQKPEIQQEIVKNQALAQALAIEATPAFVIGDTVVPGAIDENSFRDLIAKAKAAKAPAPAAP